MKLMSYTRDDGHACIFPLDPVTAGEFNEAVANTGAAVGINDTKEIAGVDGRPTFQEPMLIYPPATAEAAITVAKSWK